MANSTTSPRRGVELGAPYRPRQQDMIRSLKIAEDRGPMLALLIPLWTCHRPAEGEATTSAQTHQLLQIVVIKHRHDNHRSLAKHDRFHFHSLGNCALRARDRASGDGHPG